MHLKPGGRVQLPKPTENGDYYIWQSTTAVSQMEFYWRHNMLNIHYLDSRFLSTCIRMRGGKLNFEKHPKARFSIFCGCTLLFRWRRRSLLWRRRRRRPRRNPTGLCRCHYPNQLIDLRITLRQTRSLKSMLTFGMFKTLHFCHPELLVDRLPRQVGGGGRGGRGRGGRGGVRNYFVPNLGFSFLIIRVTWLFHICANKYVCGRSS